MGDFYGYDSDYRYGYGDGYGDGFGRAEREFGRNCDSARRLLESSREGDALNIDVGVIFSGNYGLQSIEGTGSGTRQFNGFCSALEEFPDDRVIDSLKFHHFDMNRGGALGRVESAIKTKHIKHLTFQECLGNGSPTKAAEVLSGFLETNQTLEELTVDCTVDCGILNRRFSNAVRDHPTLDKVDMANFRFSDEEFTSFMEGVKDMSEVTIRRGHHQSIDNEMTIAHLIPPVLATNPQLQKLRLSGARMSNWDWTQRGREYHDANAFAQALSTNSNLKDLILADTNHEVRDILLKAIYDDTSLNSVATSNHICLISVEPGDSLRGKYKSLAKEYEWFQGGDEVSLARKSKLLCAAGTFKEDCINIHHFTGVPLALIPEVVEFIGNLTVFEGKVDDSEKLARLAFKNVFELMRNVVAPLLPTQGKSGLKRKRNYS